MQMRLAQRLPWLALGLTITFVLGSGVSRAQSASAPALKAAFLYNFAKFTEWPSDSLPAGAPLVMCVVDNLKLARALEEATAGREVEGHALVVRKIEMDGPVRSCHVLYADVDPKAGARLIEALKGAPVLAVTDFGQFAAMGGTTSLFVEDGRIRFAVNVEAANRARLRISSRLLSLAKLVKDDPNAAQD
jgi:hypothetical protein